MSLKKVVVCGGNTSVISSFRSKLFELGLEMGWHWENGDKIPDQLPARCEGVVILTNMFSHTGSYKASLLAKKVGVPLVLTVIQWSTARQRLIAAKLGDPHFMDRPREEILPPVVATTTLKEEPVAEQKVEPVAQKPMVTTSEILRRLGWTDPTLRDAGYMRLKSNIDKLKLQIHKVPGVNPNGGPAVNALTTDDAETLVELMRNEKPPQKRMHIVRPQAPTPPPSAPPAPAVEPTRRQTVPPEQEFDQALRRALQLMDKLNVETVTLQDGKAEITQRVIKVRTLER